MKDDFSIPNIGQAPQKYDSGYLNRVVRNVEMIFTTLRAKGEINVTDIVADTVTATTVTAEDIITDTIDANTGTIDTFTFNSAITHGGDIKFERTSVPTQFLQINETSTGGVIKNFSDVSNAKPIVYDSTTVLANTAPSGGSLGHYFRTLGVNRVWITDTGINVAGTSTFSGAATFDTTSTFTGLSTFNGDMVSNAGLAFGSTVASAPEDLSRHVALWGTIYGMTVTSSQFNFVCPTTADFVWYDTTGVERMRFDNALSSLSGMIVRITDAADMVSLATTTQGFQLGATAAANLAMDSNEIQARNNGVAASLAINPFGGDVSVGLAGVTSALALNHGHLSFPATQNPSTGVNILDDYEEGSWTPVLTYATPGTQNIVSTVAGRYIKIGKLVNLSCLINTTTHTIGTGSGALNVTGLPFLAATVSGMSWSSAIDFQGLTLAAGHTVVTAGILSNTQIIRFISAGSAVTRASIVATTNTTSGTQIALIINLQYEAST